MLLNILLNVINSFYLVEKKNKSCDGFSDIT
jgi:hypothetical protein